MEVKKKLLNNKIFGYYFLFYRIYDESNQKFNNLDMKSNNNDRNDNEQAKILVNNNRKKGTQNLHSNTFTIKNIEKVSFHTRKSIEIRQNIKLYEESKKSEDNLKVINESEFNINKEFIPKDVSHFLFNINNFSYEFVKDKNNDESLNKILKEEASNKIKVYNEKLKPLIKTKKKSKDESDSDSDSYYDSFSDSEDGNESENINEIFSSTHTDTSDQNPRTDRKLSSKNNRATLIEKPRISLNKITPSFGKSVTITSDKMKKNKINNSKIGNDSKKENINFKDHKNISGKYYKINISNVFFLMYDFNKDYFEEVNTEKIIPKIEEVLSDISKNEKDDIYSFYSFQNDKSKSKNKEKQKKESNINNINNSNNSLDREKSIEKEIVDTINEKEEEAPIIRTKIYSAISFCTMLILGVLSLNFCLSYYSSINQLISLIKISVKIKYCNYLSLYFVRELTLLNFNAARIIGGEYVLFPSKNRTTYIKICVEQLMELFKENQNMTKLLFFPQYTLSINQTKYIEKLTFNTNFLVKGTTKIIISDLYATLLQYNNAFYSLISNGKNIHQSQSDVFVFINNNQVFKGVIQILIDVYRLELEQIIKKMKLILIICSISFFIIFILIFIILMLAVLSANKRRINYVHIFFGINEDLLRDIMKNCEEVIDKLKNGGNIEYQEIEKSDSYINENHLLNNKKMIINKNDNNSKAINLNNKKKLNESNLGDELIHFILLGIFFLIIYFFFVYICYFLFNLSNRALLMSNFFFRYQNFQLNIIEIFNTYRQFVFDEQTKLRLDFSEILDNTILDEYDTISYDVEYIQSFLIKNLDKKIGNEINTKSLCSLNLTDYFNSIDECEEKYSNILKYDFNIFATNFIEEIREKKNIVKYLLSTGKIIGRLNQYNLGLWMKDDLIPKKGIINENTPNDTMFRLNLFNNETIHNDLNNIFINIIFPYLNGNRKIILETFSFEGYNFHFIIIIIFYLIIVSMVFIGYWFPIIISLNNSIYKTKKMLTIIPIKILACQNNINLLLKKKII